MSISLSHKVNLAQPTNAERECNSNATIGSTRCSDLIRGILQRLSGAPEVQHGISNFLNKQYADVIAHIRAMQRVRAKQTNSGFERRHLWEQARRILAEPNLSADYSMPQLRLEDPLSNEARTAQLKQAPRGWKHWVERQRSESAYGRAMRRADTNLRLAKAHLKMHKIAFQEGICPGSLWYDDGLIISPEGDSPLNQLAQRLAEHNVHVVYSPKALARSGAGAFHSIDPTGHSKTSVLCIGDSEVFHCCDANRLMSPILKHELQHVLIDQIEKGAIRQAASPYAIFMEGSPMLPGYGSFCHTGELPAHRAAVERAVEIAKNTEEGTDENVLAKFDAVTQARSGEKIARFFQDFAAICLEEMESSPPKASNIIDQLSMGRLKVRLDSFSFDPSAPIDAPHKVPEASTPVKMEIFMYDANGYLLRFKLEGPYRLPPSRLVESHQPDSHYVCSPLDNLPPEEREAWEYNVNLLKQQITALKTLSLEMMEYFHKYSAQ